MARHYFKILFLIFLVSAPNAYAQKNRLYALTYKYKEGDKYRISTGTYQNFSTASKSYNHSSYGETAFDLYEEITGADGESFDTSVKIELTRHTVDGRNLTYKMANLFTGDALKFTFDRFGKIKGSTVQYENVSGKKESFEKNLNIIRNIFIPLPSYPVKLGDAWKIEDYFDQKQIHEMFASEYVTAVPEVRGAYSLDNVDQGIAKIGLSLEISGIGKLSAAGDSLQLDYLVQVTGAFYFNIIDGKITTGSLITQIGGLGKSSDEEIEFNGSEITNFNSEKYK